LNNSIKKAPAVSVVLAEYNRADYLNRCMDSLLKQSFTDWELIAIDDGSTDNSFDVLYSYSQKYPNIRVFRQDNMKLPLTRNKGIRESSGRYITFLDSDDEYEIDHLKCRVEYMEENPQVDLLSGGVKIIGNEYVRDKDNLKEFIHLSKCVIGATFFGKRIVFELLNGFKNIAYSEDSEFWQRASSLFNTVRVDYPTYIYHREVSDSITNSLSAQMD